MENSNSLKVGQVILVSVCLFSLTLSAGYFNYKREMDKAKPQLQREKDEARIKSSQGLNSVFKARKTSRAIITTPPPQEEPKDHTLREKIIEPVPVEKKFGKTNFPPQFPGGDVAFRRYVAAELESRIPYRCQEAGNKGQSTIQFDVESNGDLSGFYIVEGVPGCPEFSSEIIQILKRCPRWNPGSLRGESKTRREFSIRLDSPGVPEE